MIFIFSKKVIKRKKTKLSFAKRYLSTNITTIGDNLVLRKKKVEMAKVYDLKKINLFLNDANLLDFLQSNKLLIPNYDFLFAFHSNNEKMKMAFEEFNFEYLFKFDDDIDSYCFLFSTLENGYLSREDFKNLVSKASNLSVLGFDYDSIRSVPDPKEWLDFLASHFGIYVKNAIDILKMIDYLCLNFISIFKNLNNSIKIIEENDLVTICVPLVNRLDDADYLTKTEKKFFQIYTKLQKFSSNSNETTLAFENLICYYFHKSTLIDQVISSPVDKITEILKQDNSFNTFISFGKKDFNQKDFIPLLFKIFIKGFYECESLFIPGKNINKEILDFNFSDIFQKKQQNYNDIVEQEYLSILVYIYKIATKYKIKYRI